MGSEQSVVYEPPGGADQVAVAYSWAARVAIAAFLAIYLLSGFSALLYQVVWHRMLAIFSGSDLYATTTIVSAFMAGLGAGSLLGGLLADRLTRAWQIGLFALLELLIGGFALISTWWYYDVLYVRYAALAGSPLVLAAVLFSSLVIPTVCMGMSFPLISKVVTPSVALAGRRIGSLYAWNTLGAAVGAGVTVWWLMGALDFRSILHIGARINVVVAVLAVAVGITSWARLDRHLPDGTGPLGETGGLRRTAFSFSTWMWLYGLAGFLALSWEIVWFRLLGVMLKSNSFTFAHLLGVYLASLAVGIMAGTRLVHRGSDPGRLYLMLQGAATLYAGLSLVLLFQWLDQRPALAWLRAYLGGYEPLDVIPVRQALESWRSDPGGLLAAVTGSEPSFLGLYVLVPFAIVGPPMALMGASFAFLQRTVQDDHARLGRRVGWLQAANILGATLGAIVTGTILLHLFGTAWSLRILIAAGGIFLLLWLELIARAAVARRTLMLAAAAGLLAIVWSIPSGPQLWASLHGSPLDRIISAEDGSGVAALKNDSPDFASTTMVYVNGLGQSWLPYHHVNMIHSQLGILPIMLHPAPREVAVIGLGSGDTPYSLGGRPETVTITCIEIVTPQLETLRLLHARRPYGGIEGLLHDPRIRFVFTDGRTYLATQAKRYDVIEADALRPNSAFAGNLYSYEYFKLLESRLNPGGLAVTWVPTWRVAATFASAFPYVLDLGSVMVGSRDPIEYDPDVIRARVEHPFTQAYYARAGIDVMAAAAPLLKAADYRVDVAAIPRDINRDLHPKDEYGR